jgi:zinc transporter, ZIP family
MNYNQVFIPFFLTLLAGLSTVIGSLIFLSNKFSDKKYLSFFLGLSAGVMIYLSFVELLPYAVSRVGFLHSNSFFFLGIIFMVIIDFLLPHHYLAEKISGKNKIVNYKMLSSGIVVTIGLIIHNFPEGMAVFLSSFTEIKLGALLAIAIAIHNIPEGIAVAAPIYHATLDKGKAVKYAFISGMTEPMGAIFAYLLLKPYLNQNIISYVFALVAGIMLYISFDELLPACFKDSQGHQAIIGIISGMIISFFSILFL